MAEIIVQDCDNCNKRKNCCCKTCFEEDESNIFIPLTDEELDILVDEKQQILYKAGETIVKQNTTSSYVLCFKEGLAKVYVESANKNNLILKIAQKGDFLTGGGFFNGNVQHVTISAITPVTCCLISSAKLTKLFSENIEFATRLMRNHTKQNNFLLEKLINHTQKYMPGRVADTLLYLKNEIYKELTYTVPLKRQDLADMSNMTKESFVRILQQFKESNLVKIKGNTISILNEESLQNISKNG